MPSTPLSRALAERDEALEDARQLRVTLARGPLPTYRDLRLSVSQYAIVDALISRVAGVHREMLQARIEAVTDNAWSEPEDSLRVQIYRLRKKLNRLIPPIRIETMWGDGYRMNAADVALLAARRVT